MAEKLKRRRSKERLIDADHDVDGVSNPTLDEELEKHYEKFSQSQTEGETSTAEMEENAKAEMLKGELKTRHRRRKRELSKLVTPKDDLTGQMKTVKLQSLKKLEDTERETELSDALAGTSALSTETSPLQDETTEIMPLEDIPTLATDAVSTSPTPLLPQEEVVSTLERETSIKVEEEERPATDRKRTTIREKMKLRLAKAKEEEEAEIEKLERDERKKTLKKETRFEELNETELAKLEERTERMRQLRLQRTKQQESLSFMPTAEQAFDFFTRAWEPEAEETEGEKKDKPEPKPEQPEGEEPETEEERAAKEEGKDEESKLLVDEDYTEEGYGPVAIRKAQLVDVAKVQKAESEMLFFPSTAPVPATEKVGGEVEPRFLEDEGFYVGVKPYVSDRNKSKMENRLLKEAEKQNQVNKWFGEDGQLVILPDPLRDAPTRPQLQDEEIPYIETYFFNPIMREFDSRYIDGAIDGGGFYQLDVDINSISFTHHHLFSREHVLANKLTLFYEEYLVRSKRNITDFLVDKLAALKNSAHLLHTYIASHKGEMSVSDRDNYERRLRDYKSEIRQTRFMRDKEEQTDRTLLKNIIHTWKEVKALRETQKFTNTPVKLQIRKEETNKAEDTERWRFEMEEEFNEEREKYEEDFMRKEAIYRDQMEKYEKQLQAVEEAKKRIAERNKQRRGSKASKVSKVSRDSPRNEQPDEDEEGIEEENARDQEIIDEEPLAKPEPPEAFDETAVREQIKAKAMAQKRRPGEPKLFPELSNSATVTPPDQCTRGEQLRREEVSKSKLYVRILFNGKEVSRTGPRPLSQEFKVNFGQIYNLKIVEWPESIKYEIYETAGFGSGRMLAELFAPIPESSVTSVSVGLENVEFSSYEKIQYQHEGVGSGVAFKFEGHVPDLVTLMTSGVLNSSVAWAVGEDGLPLVPMEKFGANYYAAMQMKRLDPFAAIGASGVANLEKLLHWFKDSRLDPNDPNNKDIVYMLSGSDQTLLQPREYFRLEPLQQEFNLATWEELENNVRFKMIELRDTENPMFKGYQMIPVNEKEVPRDILKEYEKKLREESQLAPVKGDLEQHRAQVNLYLQKIKNRVLAQYRFASHQRSLQDMVYEDNPPNYALIFKSLMRLSEPRRPLKPVRKERKKVTAQALHGQEVKILINIIRATYVPVRKTSASPAPGSTTARDTQGKPFVDPYGELVCPFVEVMFQRSRVRTRRGDGPNPSFNEKLELILKVPNDDYSPSALQNIDDIIFLNVFDEVTVDVLEDNRQRETNVHQRIEKKWLGSIKIPFSTVYFNNKIDGTFRLNTPPILLGYTYDQSQLQHGLVDMDPSAARTNTYLTMFVTLEPSLTLPDPFKEKLSTNEEEELIQHADVWQEKLEKKFPGRIFKTTVMDTTGRNVFVTRFFRPIKPPPEVESCTDPGRAMELAARYVSLIPFVADTALFPGQCDIWSTCNQFMKMLCGDEEEHAVLLTNFFLGLGKKAWLLLGNAIPEGRTAYVLTDDNGVISIWNARSGEKYGIHDNYCPIQSVGCVINAENIYANVQQYEKPSQMNFNLNNSSHWQSFYNKSFPSRGLASVQPNVLTYRRKDKKFEGLVMELQEKIEQLLKNKIMEWRSRYITRWNRHCTQIMRKLLPKLEENCGKPIEESNLRDLEESFKSYKVSGFPLNIPYTDMDSITETVFSTGVHAQETSEVEFALAVYVHGYTNNVMSIWIYVASLLRMR
ncbi:coiled-coil and C2 domain-containing protein 2A-like isoform X2 [Physella acuta]|uniref:coiled-coil and C2 domain-containing protein 2A-like isoform X2 n=1 Tax=Physella acuta TaxID=109671 RepID=UPI0027DE31E1|nr:coiled-coil and C2 domain-containing protein 2A-like isoform X2 [Physella acuta]